MRRVEGRVRGGGRGPDPQTARRVQARRARPQISVGGGRVGAGVGPVRAVPAVPAHAAARGLHDQRHRIVEPPAGEGRPQPRPVPRRPGRSQAPVAGYLRHRGQTRRATGEGGQGQATRRRVPAHRGAGSPPTGNGPSPDSPPHTPNAWNHTSKKQQKTSIHKQFDKLSARGRTSDYPAAWPTAGSPAIRSASGTTPNLCWPRSPRRASP